MGVYGILQSFRDAIKLFIKEQLFPYKLNHLVYYFSPVFSLFIIFLTWISVPINSNFLNILFSGIFFFCCTSFGVYCLIGRGWSSNSNYALIGSVRGVAQTISYEVRIALFFLRLIFLISRYRFHSFIINQSLVWFFYSFFPVFLCWRVSILAETNRTPFDFAEGESELVSGFNIEYGSGGFALLFLAEYARIIFISYLISFLFFGRNRTPFFSLIGCFFCFTFIWVRGCYPRYRYDKLIYLAWRTYLPVSLFCLFFYIFFKFLVL